MSNFKYKSGLQFPVSADVAAEMLDAIRSQNDGVLKPEHVVDAARDEDHPLHGCFTWDDSEAAEQWRKAEARKLISSIRVLKPTENGPRSVIAFVSIRDPELGRTYLPTNEVIAVEQRRERMLMEALSQLEAWRRRYADLEELRPVAEAIRQVQEEVRQPAAS